MLTDHCDYLDQGCKWELEIGNLEVYYNKKITYGEENEVVLEDHEDRNRKEESCFGA